MTEGVAAIVERRRGQQAAAIELGRRYATSLAVDVPLVAAVIFGSYARGDFNTWSDVDMLIISDGLPEDSRERFDLLWRHRLGGISPIGWTTRELELHRQRDDPVATEAETVGLTVAGTLPPT